MHCRPFRLDMHRCEQHLLVNAQVLPDLPRFIVIRRHVLSEGNLKLLPKKRVSRSAMLLGSSVILLTAACLANAGETTAERAHVHALVLSDIAWCGLKAEY